MAMGHTKTRVARTTRGTATRARIVDAATTLVRARGVRNTSVDAVLAASRASKSQLYHYFSNKDDLVLAVIQCQADRVLATHAPHLLTLDSLAGLRRWRDAIVEHARVHHCAGGCPLGSLASSLAESARPRAQLSQGFARWESYLVTGFGKMRIGANEAAALATAVMAALQGGLLLAQIARSTRPLELALDMAIEHVTHRMPRRPTYVGYAPAGRAVRRRR
jgi:TetR/AcrR family transcriptional repressor of nem operon